MPRFHDLTDKIFGRLTATERIFQNNKTYWRCVCSCGETKVTQARNLTAGNTKSCGCLDRETRQGRIKDHSNRTCTACKAALPISCFSGFDPRKGYYTAKCKECAKTLKRKRYADDELFKEKVKARAKIDSKKRPPCSSEEKRRQHLWYDFGLTLEAYDMMLTEQNNRCALCKSDAFGRKGSNNWAVDHCHKTGNVRGLLCALCNLALGGYESFIDKVGEEAIKSYLQNSP